MTIKKKKKIVILTQVHTTEAYYPIFSKVKIRAYKKHRIEPCEKLLYVDIIVYIMLIQDM